MNQMTSEKYLNFFLLMAFWKFQHFNLVSKISQILFKPLPFIRVLDKFCMLSAYLQWRFHSGERVVARGPFVKRNTVSFLKNLESHLFAWLNNAEACNDVSLRKHAYSNILKVLLPKNENFQNSDILHISAQNIIVGICLNRLGKQF